MSSQRGDGFASNKRQKGRGRGSTSKNQQNVRGFGSRSAWMQGSPNSRPSTFDTDDHKAEQRFSQARQEQLKAAEQLMQTYNQEYESSSDEEDLNDDEILSKLTSYFKGTGDHHANGQGPLDVSLGITAQYLTESCQSGALTCLVCISSIKRAEQTWNCKVCFSIFHLPCIKQWVLEGIAQATLLSDEYFPNRDQPWYCPKCRNEFQRSECPQTYKCFCGSRDNPPTDPWLLPHSCGSKCNKPLKNPNCGHQCLLLCHPGPCPPCPQTVMLPCHCGKQRPKMQRCGKGEWSCGQPCSKQLACRKHRCQMTCHGGECTPCERSSIQDCVCGGERRIQPCLEPTWQCDKVCGKKLECAHHSCEKVCHRAGDCGQCPRSGERTCPCGKLVFAQLTCTEEVATCQDTCGKHLGCFGAHKCPRKCHFGPCGSCPLMTNKPCRCGKREKEVPCQKQYTCETRCQKIRRCGNHQCKRKCCTGDCPPCEQTCGKSLQCKKHKCQMFCHQGPCYPCPLTSKVGCRCGSSVVTVVCGKEKATKPPRCRKLCQIKPNCHHAKRLPHICHFGDCPSCKQICLETLKCDHSCPAVCHDNVLVKNAAHTGAPWERHLPEYKMERTPCPPCQVPVGVVCRGQHETSTFPCCDVRDFSCGRACGRALQCGNHSCAILCHVVLEASGPTKAGSTCTVCEEPCAFPRPNGCSHPCELSCHSGECPSCRKRIRMKCHCGAVQLKHLCSEWTVRSEAERDRMTSCGSSCPRTLTPCGHMCPMHCHSGDCPAFDTCTKRVILRCPCKRKKKDFVCGVLQNNKQKVTCDEVCEKIKAEKQAEKDQAERQKREAEEKRQKEEVERFERKLHRRSRVNRRPSTGQETNEGWWSRFKEGRAFVVLQFFLAFSVILVAFGFAYYGTVV